MKQTKYDIAVIGGGPGGYPAAIKAAQSGKTVALIEGKELGGTCLNRGCIPSKALISGAELLHRIKGAEEFGISVGKISLDYNKMVQRKDGVVSKIRQGLAGLIASNKITLIKGYGKLISPREIKVTGEDNLIVEADKIIIATGSEPRNLSAFPFDYARIHDSTSLLEMKALPKSIVIIGGGIIGCEFASLYAEFDVKVTILEMLPRIIPMEDEKVSDALSKAFQKKGIVIKTGVTVAGIDKSDKGVSARLSNGETFPADVALVSVGRMLNTSNIGLDKAGVIVNANGLIPVDEHMETNVPGIYAIGDIASKWWLAHVASHQGLVAASNAIGQTARMDYNAVPSVIFTNPEIGTVGLTLEAAKTQGYQAVTGAFPFQALGKSQASAQTEGFAQIVLDKRTGQILGAQVVGHEASILIAEMAVAIANELTVECIADTIHAHPTVTEAWMEAALVGMNSPLHLPPKR
jgi:dihydrolipoamide dehydrogenase